MPNDSTSRGSRSGGGASTSAASSAAPHGNSRPPSTTPQRSSSSWITTPAPIRRLFARFPLQVRTAEHLPATGHDCQQARSSDQELPVLYVFNNQDAAATGQPSFNPSCLQHQAWLRIHGVRVKTVASSNHAAPGGALPFLVPARQRQRGRSEKTDEKHGAGVATADTPIPAAKLWAWAEAQDVDPGARSTLTEPDALQRARQSAYLSLIEHRLRAAWLLALYLTPANYPLVEALYIHPSTSSSLIHKLQSTSLSSAAREALHNLSPPSIFTPLFVNFSSFRPASSVFPSEDDAIRIYSAAGDALDALAALLGDGDWFFGRPCPGRLDVVLFSYVHLIFGDQRVMQGMVDRRWLELRIKGPTRNVLFGHWERMMRACGWSDL